MRVPKKYTRKRYFEKIRGIGQC
nr:ribosomal protein L32 [Viola suavis]UVF33044.1 ribosomal protein L32 [Viola suavis]UZC29527.1 ribosomal protein L32 [Viola acuminata]